jgi:hypothetical protein
VENPKVVSMPSQINSQDDGIADALIWRIAGGRTSERTGAPVNAEPSMRTNFEPDMNITSRNPEQPWKAALSTNSTFRGIAIMYKMRANQFAPICCQVQMKSLTMKHMI